MSHRFLNYLFRHLPRKNNRMVFEGQGRYDNGYILFLEASKDKYGLDCYFIDHHAQGPFIPKTRVIPPESQYFTWREKIAWHLIFSRARVCFFSQTIPSYLNVRTQLVYLSHGIGNKYAPDYINKMYTTGCDCLFPSLYIANLFRKRYKMSHNRCIILRQPRTDLLPMPSDRKRALIRVILGARQFSKILLWMPTFRSDGAGGAATDYTNLIDLDRLNSLLIEQNSALIIKRHHIFGKVDIDPRSNICIIYNEDILPHEIEPTEMLCLADALITDYSSCVADYLFLQKPLLFFAPDLNAMVQGHLATNDLRFFMPGPITKTNDELLAQIKALLEGADDFADRRAEACATINGPKPLDSFNARRIIRVYCQKGEGNDKRLAEKNMDNP